MDKKYFFGYQKDWINDPARFSIVEKSRRTGITYGESYRTVRDSASDNVKNKKTWFSSADLSAAEEFIDYVGWWAKILNTAAKHIGEVLIDKDQDITAHRVVFSNDVQVNAISSNPEKFRSKGGDIILDEFAHHRDQVKMFTAAKPSMMWGNRVRIISTHNGDGSFFNSLIKEIKKGKEGSMKNWSHHNIPIDRAIKEGLVDRILGHKASEEDISEFLEDTFSGMTQEAIDEEFYCIPRSDSANHLLTYDLINAIERDNILFEDIDKLFALATGPLFAGIDVGRKSDRTSIIVGELLGEIIYTRLKISLKDTTFTKQEEYIYYLLSHPLMRRACIDATGLGMQMAERAKEKFGSNKVEEVTFTNSSKAEMAEYTYVSVEGCKVLIPRDKEMRDDLYKIRAVKTAAGNTRYEATRDEKGHADNFWGLALMLEASRNYGSDVRIHSGGRPISLSRFNNYFGGY